MLAGIGENAGVIDIGQGYAVTFKVESHNHPSYVEPYQGAATGVGGIVRDILAMGARPVAVMDPLRFGPLDAAGHPPGAARDRRRRRRLRQLPRPAQHRRRGRLRRDATSATRWSTRSASACCGTRTCTWPRRPASATRSSCTAPRPAATASAASRVLASRDLRRSDGSGQAAQRPGRRPVHGEAAHRVHPRALRRRRWSPASRTSAAPGSRAPPPSWPAPATAACTSSSTGCRCATPRSRPRRS